MFDLLKSKSNASEKIQIDKLELLPSSEENQNYHLYITDEFKSTSSFNRNFV